MSATMMLENCRDVGIGYRTLRLSAESSTVPIKYTVSESLADIAVLNLPLLKETDALEQRSLLLVKLQQCCIVYDFSNSTTDLQAKEVKRATLNELIDFVSSSNSILSGDLYPEIISVISRNVFRTLPPPVKDDSRDVEFEESDTNLTPSWSHLQLVYEFFLRFLESPEFQSTTAKKFIDHRFIMQLLETLRSEDPRERDFLKTVLHRIYGKFLSYRGFIRQQIGNIFLTFIYEEEDFAGLPELLEIFGSIINGFALPLRSEHMEFLLRVLVPLHKATCLILFHSQLTYCIVQFLEKDATLTPSVVKGIMKFWPVTCSSKEIMFISEIEEILDVIDPIQFAVIHKELFVRLSHCVASPHFQVAERALYLWYNECIVNLIEENSASILPLIFPNLYRISKDHWNATIVSLVYNVLKILVNMNKQLFEELTLSYNAERQKEQRRLKDHQNFWRHMDELCCKREPTASARLKN